MSGVSAHTFSVACPSCSFRFSMTCPSLCLLWLVFCAPLGLLWLVPCYVFCDLSYVLFWVFCDSSLMLFWIFYSLSLVLLWVFYGLFLVRCLSLDKFWRFYCPFYPLRLLCLCLDCPLLCLLWVIPRALLGYVLLCLRSLCLVRSAYNYLFLSCKSHTRAFIWSRELINLALCLFLYHPLHPPLYTSSW